MEYKTPGLGDLSSQVPLVMRIVNLTVGMLPDILGFQCVERPLRSQKPSNSSFSQLLLDRAFGQQLRSYFGLTKQQVENMVNLSNLA